MIPQGSPAAAEQSRMTKDPGIRMVAQQHGGPGSGSLDTSPVREAKTYAPSLGLPSQPDTHKKCY